MRHCTTVRFLGALALVRDSTAHALIKLAFEFLVLTAARSGEVRNAAWSEINWDTLTWEIPAFRMKAKRPHRVPLSGRAVEVLTAAWEISGTGGLIFPGGPKGRAPSDMTLTALLRRLGIPAVPHGFRSSFRNWVEECTASPVGSGGSGAGPQRRQRHGSRPICIDADVGRLSGGRTRVTCIRRTARNRS